MLRRLAAALLMLCAATPAAAEWRKATTEKFTVYSDGGEAQLRAFITRLQRFDTFLRGRLGVANDPGAPRLTVFLVSNDTAVQRAMGTKLDYVAGFYTAGPYGPMAVVPRTRAATKFDLDGGVVLFHEYAHHFMWQYFSAPYPPWFSEAFAEFYSTTTFDEAGHANIGKPAYHRGYDLTIEPRPMPARRLLTTEIGELSKDDVGIFYGRAWLLYHFLNFEPGRKAQLPAYIGAVIGGKPPLEAAQAAFGDLDRLDGELKRYLAQPKMSYSQTVTVTPPPAELSVVPVEAGEASIMADRIAMMRTLGDDERDATVADLKAAAGRTPASGAVHLWLAQALLEAEDEAGAIKAADAALAIDPALGRAWLVKARAQSRLLIKAGKSDEASWRAIRVTIGKANRADVNDPLPLAQYFHSFHDQGIEPTALAGTGLARAAELMPQDLGLRMNYGAYLMSGQKLAEAIRVIEPIAYSPHGGGLAATARRYVDRMRAAIKAGKPLTWSDEDLLETAGN